MINLLSIQNLSINFTGNEETLSAVTNISIDVHSGELVAIVGESGSGKSVTALSILQLIPSPSAKYTRGEIWFSDKAGNRTNLLKASPEYLRKNVEMKFQ